MLLAYLQIHLLSTLLCHYEPKFYSLGPFHAAHWYSSPLPHPFQPPEYVAKPRLLERAEKRISPEAGA